MQPAKTQEQQETQNSLHHLSAALPGEEVPTETVPVHRGEGRVLQLAQPHGDAGEDLVSEPQGQGQETAGGRAGETQAGSQAAAAGLRLPAAAQHRTHGRTGALRGPERTAARLTRPRTFQWTVWDVLPVLVNNDFHMFGGGRLKRKKKAFKPLCIK